MPHAASTTTQRRSGLAAIARALPIWSTPLGALIAAMLSFWTGGVHLAALAVLAALYLVSILRARTTTARDPLGPLAGFVAPALAVGALTGSALGVVEGLLWGGFVRVFLIEQSRR